MVSLAIYTDRGQPVYSFHISPVTGWGDQLKRSLPRLIDAIAKAIEEEILDGRSLPSANDYNSCSTRKDFVT